MASPDQSSPAPVANGSDETVISSKVAGNHVHELKSGKKKDTGRTLTVEDKKHRIDALKKYQQTLPPRYQRELDKKLSGFEAAMKQHVTAETDRAIEAGAKTTRRPWSW